MISEHFEPLFWLLAVIGILCFGVANAAPAPKTCYSINCMYSTGVLHACFKWNSGTLEDAKKYVEAESTAPGLVTMTECVEPGKEPIVVRGDKQGINTK